MPCHACQKKPTLGCVYKTHTGARTFFFFFGGFGMLLEPARHSHRIAGEGSPSLVVCLANYRGIYTSYKERISIAIAPNVAQVPELLAADDWPKRKKSDAPIVPTTSVQ